MRSLRIPAPLLLLLMLSGGSASAHAQDIVRRLEPHARTWEALTGAEDDRARTPAQLATIFETLHSEEPELRRLAVRALGRLERATLADTIAALLHDRVARVRAEAAHAFAQAWSRGAPGSAPQTLSALLESEPDAQVRAALAESLGRLRHGSAEQARQTLNRLLPELTGSAALGAVRGLYFLARQPPARTAFDSATRIALLRVAVPDGFGLSDQAIRLRVVGAAALATIGADAAALGGILRGDPVPRVRREAAAALFAHNDTARTAAHIVYALSDTSGLVRYEGLRAYGRRLTATRGCDPVVQSVGDAHPHTALLAIDLLGSACRTAGTQLLDSLANALPEQTGGAWHRAAHALVALAAQSPERAQRHLPRFAAHGNFFVRTYAAMAAGAARDTTMLLQLTNDAHPNVRTAALEALRRHAGHAADSVYIAQLSQDDSQLLMTAAAALDSTTHARAADALLAALDRITRRRSETSRDARVALLVRLRQIGNARLVERVRPYLRDFDPEVAARAADAIEAWSGTRPEPQPSDPPPRSAVSFAEAAALAGTRVNIELESGDRLELELYPFDAPTNAARFARLARTRYFDGLTLHRIAPNFVVQGGSPNANEYAGDAPFTRDELGLENWRGTVGLSTRGRDTGDAQIFINLIDNVRLDHDYTVFARVVRGMEIVDRLLEGAVMRRVLIGQ